MDYSIAFILPNTTTCETVKQVLRKLNLRYPIYARTAQNAVSTARELLPKGLHLVVSQGITLQYLSNELPIPTLELPFSGLDTLLVVRSTVEAYPDKKIVHIGTKHMFYYVQRSLRILGMAVDRIAFRELTQTIPQEQVAQECIDEGYDVFIGGFTIMDYIRTRGKIGFEFYADALSVEATLLNAQTLVSNIKNLEERNELDRAILQSTPDGIIVIDSSRQIIQVNSATLDIIKVAPESLIGQPINDILEKHNIIDIEQVSLQNEVKGTAVLMREIPVMVRGAQKGTVIAMSCVSDIQNLEYRTKADLLQKGLVAKYTFDDIQGTSSAIQNVKALAYTYAKYDSPILLYGETGTGKELFAQSIHNASKRRSQPFVAINCASLSESLIESELFGYAPGSFTGANKGGKQGLFELSDHGTIFLDEISELSISIQSKLLRAVQEGEIMRIGGDKVLHVDTRVICSSNKDLLQLIREKKFKDDLYYRLCVLELDIPPLRERKGDIELLAYSIMRNCAHKYGKMLDTISPEVLSALSQMYFGGNIRELRSIMERMVILSTGRILDMDILKKSNLRFFSGSQAPDAEVPLNFKDMQRTMILEALEKCDGSKTAAAQMLGINTSTLYRKIKQYGFNIT